jgi:hypothetical protein
VAIERGLGDGQVREIGRGRGRAQPAARTTSRAFGPATVSTAHSSVTSRVTRSSGHWHWCQSSIQPRTRAAWPLLALSRK